MPIKKTNREEVFVSYSHVDKKWLMRLQVHLNSLERSHKVIVWSDTKLRGGDKWETEIKEALSRAKVAILLVSPDFLASDFIHNNELPPLLQASKKEGSVILPVIIGRCAFTDSPIDEYQAISDLIQPLNNLNDGQVDEVLYQLYKRVYSIFVPPAPSVNTLKPKSTTPRKQLQRRFYLSRLLEKQI